MGNYHKKIGDDRVIQMKVVKACKDRPDQSHLLRKRFFIFGEERGGVGW